MKPPAYRAWLNRSASRDFFRFAVPRCKTPVFAALSKAELTLGRAFAASSFLPAASNSTYLRSKLCRRDLILRLWAFLRALLRIRRSADFVFGIGIDCSAIQSAHVTLYRHFVNREPALEASTKILPASIRPGLRPRITKTESKRSLIRKLYQLQDL